MFTTKISTHYSNENWDRDMLKSGCSQRRFLHIISNENWDQDMLKSGRWRRNKSSTCWHMGSSKLWSRWNGPQYRWQPFRPSGQWTGNPFSNGEASRGKSGSPGQSIKERNKEPEWVVPDHGVWKQHESEGTSSNSRANPTWNTSSASRLWNLFLYGKWDQLKDLIACFSGLPTGDLRDDPSE